LCDEEAGRFVVANPSGKAADGGEGFGVGGAGLSRASEAYEAIAAALEKNLRTFGGSGQTTEAG